MKNWKTPEIKNLVAAFAALNDPKDVQNFLRDLCTLEELGEMSKRWAAVRLLEAKMPYRLIAEKTGLSTTTVTRIAHWLRNGEGGYAAALRQSKD